MSEESQPLAQIPTEPEAQPPVESESSSTSNLDPVSTESGTSTASASQSGWRQLLAPAWFLFGILVGFALFAAYTRFVLPSPTLEPAIVKQAAREGLLEAINELQAQSSGNNSQGPQTVDRNAFTARDTNILGSKDAPVSIVEFADFQCPFCGRHHQLVQPTIMSEYVNTGKANYIFKHLAFLGPESVYAAVAAECAADQGKFWEYHDYLFEHQQGENDGAFNKDKLIAFGQALALDQARFETCVNSDETIARVQADTTEASQFGVGSTPTFFVNGKPLVGLMSPEEFKAAIDAALTQ